jgi:hypothetical protein
MILRRHRLELQKPEVFARLGFLYDGYTVKRGMYMWESVVMVRKAAVVMIGSLIKDEYRQIFAAVTLLVFSLFLQANFQPYQTRLFNIIECVSLVTIILTQLVSMFYLRTESQMKQCMGESDVFVIDLQGTTCGQVKANASGNDMFTTVLLALVNVIFIVVCLYLMYKFYKEKESTSSSIDDVSNSTSLIAHSLRRLHRKMGVLTNREKPVSERPVKAISERIEATIENPLIRLRKVDHLSSLTSSALERFTNNGSGGEGGKLQNQQPQFEIDLDLQPDDAMSRPVKSIKSTDTSSSKTAFSPLPVVVESVVSINGRQRNRGLSDKRDVDNDVDNHQESLHLSSDEDIILAHDEREEEEEEILGDNSNENAKSGHNLPLHWIRRTDKTGDVWFENELTGELQWDAPLFDGEELSNLWYKRSDETDDVWFENAADSTIVEWELPEGGRVIEDEEE